MAAKEGGPVKTKCDACVHTYMSTSTSSKKSPTLQPHMVDSRRSQMSSDLTPVFDREENLDVGSYNGTSSSEESDYNQASVIFSLDELQNLTGLPSSVSPEISTADHNKTVNSGGLLFPGLVQDEAENLSVSSKEEQEERDRDNDHFDINSTSPPVDDHPIKSRDNSTKSNVINDDVILDNKVTKCLTHSANVETQHDMHIVVTSDDNLLCHIDSSVNTMVANAIQPNAIQPNASAVPVTVHPKLSLIYTSIDDSDVALDDYLSPISNNDKLSLIDTPHVETPHVETSSDVVTITHSSPIETPITARLSPISSSSPDNISECAEKPTDSISVSGSIATNNGSMSLYEKLKPTQSVFESPGLLYAHPVKKSSKYVVETLEPAEPATEALIAEEKKLLVTTSQKGSPHLRAKVDKRREIFVDQRQLASFDCRNLTSIPLFYPPDRGSNIAATDEVLSSDLVLKDIENNAKKAAENLDYMLDNLRYSLHAMATCTKLSVSLYKETIDDMHVTVDECIKMMYAFLAKFEELNSNMKPIEALAAQIKDVSESLKVLEKAIR